MLATASMLQLCPTPGSDSKESAYNAGDSGLIPGWGRSPGEGNGNLLQYLAWKIPWIEEPGRLQSMGSQRIGHGGVPQHKGCKVAVLLDGLKRARWPEPTSKANHKSDSPGALVLLPQSERCVLSGPLPLKCCQGSHFCSVRKLQPQLLALEPGHLSYALHPQSGILAPGLYCYITWFQI